MKNLKEKYTFDYVEKNNLLLFKCISGSHAYGTNIETSDIDIKGVFILESEDLLGLKDLPTEISDEKQDVKYYELTTFIKLLLKNNPNLIEMLNVSDEHVLFCNPMFREYFLENKNLFISKLCKDTFAGYSESQIKKARGLNKKIVNPFPDERKDLIDFCYVLDKDKSYPLKNLLVKLNYNQLFCGVQKIDHAQDIFALYYDLNAHLSYKDDSEDTLRHREANQAQGNQMGFGFKGILNPNDLESTTNIRLSSIPKMTEDNKNALKYLGLFCYNQGVFSRYCKEFREYHDWVKNRNEARYQDNLNNGKQYDGKNLAHCIRLLNTCYDLFSKGEIIVKRPERDLLLQIRKGKFDYDEIIKLAETKLNEINELIPNTNFPDVPNETEINDLLVSFKKEFYHQKITITEKLRLMIYWFFQKRILSSKNYNYKKTGINNGNS